MLAEDQEINALDLGKRASKKEGIQEGFVQGIDLTISNMINAGIFIDEQISIASGKSMKYVKATRKKLTK
mgnify:CR=1 FL=1